MAEAGDQVKVEVKPASQSKINWLQLAGIISSIAAFFGITGLDATQISAVILGIQAFVSILTVILRTFSTKTVTPEVAKDLPVA